MTFAGNCFRCGGYGHWADDGECPWLARAGTWKEHIARIDHHRDRFHSLLISPHQRSQFIREENKLWYGGKVPASLHPLGAIHDLA